MGHEITSNKRNCDLTCRVIFGDTEELLRRLGNTVENTFVGDKGKYAVTKDNLR